MPDNDIYMTEFSIDEDVLENFRFGKYRFTLELHELTWLPEYKGGTLRSIVGYLFKKTCCSVDPRTECKDCKFKSSCAYAYIYRTQVPKQSAYLKSLKNIPRPYIIEPPLDFRREIPAGEKFEFNLILIGKAVEFFPYFFVLFKNLGESNEENIGLGSRRSKYCITQVTSVDVYNQDWNILYTPDKGVQFEFVKTDQISFADILKTNSDNSIRQRVHIELLTPMDIRVKHKLVSQLEFRYLIRSLLYFTSSLSYFHCKVSPPLSDQESQRLVKDYASQVRITKDNTQVQIFPRKRQNIKGFMGDITYEGNFYQFLPLLYLGEWIHTGHGRVMGLGQYQLLHGGLHTSHL